MKIILSKFFCLFFLCSLGGFSLAGDSPRLKVKSFKELQMQNIERQTLDYSCGAASLAILLTNYFDDNYGELNLLEEILSHLSIEEIEVRMREGFSILDLKRLLDRLGYLSESVIFPQKAVLKLEDPVIILLNKDHGRHFVVLKGAKNGKAFIADPMQGNIRMPLYELFSQWDGETLVVGRHDFGLPSTHGLNLPKNYPSFPEEDSGRSFRDSPPSKPSLPYS